MTGLQPRAVTVLTTLVAILLGTAAPAPSRAWVTLSEAGTAADPFAPVLALVTLLAWVLAAWLLGAVLTTAGGHLPGQAGRVLAALARRTAPAAVRRTIEVGLGLTVVVGALAGPAAACPSGPAAASPSGLAPASSRGPAAVSSSGPEHSGAATAVVATQAPAPDLDWAAPAPAAPAAPTVVVQPGDTLWHLAEADLLERTGAPPADAQVAQAWPSWWAANRAVVGPDPDLLHPGTVLHAPASG